MQLKTQKEDTKNSYEEYCYKAVKSGKYTEVYIYHDNIFKRKTEETKEIIKEINGWDITINERELLKKEKEELKEVKENVEEELVSTKKGDVNIDRTKRRLRRLINSNINQYKEKDKFLTLTYPNLKSREKACRVFKTFCQKLRRKYGSQIQYIAVMEIQDGGRLEEQSKATNDIHFHVLLFDCPYIPQKEMQDKIWKHGIVDIRKIEEYGDVAGYLVNYLSKDDTLCVKGKRMYLPSKKIKRPLEEVSMDNDLLMKVLGNKNNEIEFSIDFNVKYVGKITYMKVIEKEDDKKEEGLKK